MDTKELGRGCVARQDAPTLEGMVIADPGVDPSIVTTDVAALAASGADIVIEVIGGIEPAKTLIESAINAGSSVVTANKALLAADGAALAQGGEPVPVGAAALKTLGLSVHAVAPGRFGHFDALLHHLLKALVAGQFPAHFHAVG